MALPPTDSSPRTFSGDPYPPTEAPDTPEVKPAKTPRGPGAGDVKPPPSSGDQFSSEPPKTPTDTYRVVQRPDGSRDVFSMNVDGFTKMGAVNIDDADKVLAQTGHYNENTKSWEVPQAIAQSLMTGRLGFPEKIAAAWNDGEVGVVRSLLGAKVMYGQMNLDDAKSQGDRELVKLRLKADPATTWNHGFGDMVAEMVKHPINTGEKALLGAVGLLPLVKDIALEGTAPGAAKGAAAGGAAAGLGALTGPLAPATAVAAVTGAMAVGAQYGTFKRAMDLMGGQFAMEMVDQGYDQKTIQKYAPIVGAVQGALTIARFDLMTAPMKQEFLQKFVASDALKKALNSWVTKYGVGVAEGAALGTTQDAVNILANNMAAAANNKPELLISGPQAKERLLNTALQMTLATGVLHAPGALAESVQLRGESGVEAKAAAEMTAKLEARAAEEPEAGKAPAGGKADKELQSHLADTQATITDLERLRKTYTEAGRPTRALDTQLQSLLNREERLKGDIKDGAIETTAGERDLVLNRPFESSFKDTDKKTAEALREEFSGIKNEQVVRGNQFAAEIKRRVPEEIERQGMFWYKAAEGDLAALQDALADPKMKEYHEQIQAALDLSPKAKDVLRDVDRYYQQAGEVSKEVGTIRSVIENYQNRIYAPEKEQDFVKTETAQGIKRTTRHALQRVFDTEFEAVRAGKTFATTDIADALSVHNEEMARVNTSRKMADSMVESGLGAWKKEIPDGWAQVGTLKKEVPIKDQNGKAVLGEDGNQITSASVMVAPEGIARGLAAIADPNFARKIDSLRWVQRYQGLVKTVDLSFSLFHHFSMVMQSVYQRDLSTLLHLPTMSKLLDAPDFAKLEQDFALHGGMTATVEANRDILRLLTADSKDTFSKIVNLPAVKQVLEQTDKNADFLFGKLQRFLKVYSYSTRVADWVAGHSDATNEQVTLAKRDIARHANSVFGGLNWEAMGMTKSNLSLLRIGLLAPDWTISNIQLLKQAIGEGGEAGKASRAHILSALTVGMIATEGLNTILTGHTTDENAPGHKLEVELAPDVYVSLLRGGIGDISKLASMIAESGLGGVSRFTQGKLAPFARTSIGLLTNTQYTGASIAKKGQGPIAGTYDVLKYAIGSLLPVPLGISNLIQYYEHSEPNAPGTAAVATGVGRYSKGKP